MTRPDFEVSMKKGAVGEAIIREKLESAGWVVYQPVTDGAHAFDILGIKDKEKAIACDVKAKALMNKWRATGVNQNHFVQYQQFSEKHSMPFWIFFVDEGLGEIYGNTIEQLEIGRRVGGTSFPKVIKTKYGKEVRLWPYAAMKKVCILEEGEVSALLEYSQRSYGYEMPPSEQVR